MGNYLDNRMRMQFRCALVGLALILAICAATMAAQTANRVFVSRIIDGDTFRTEDGETVRIIGIDAPEDDQVSTAALAAMIEGKSVLLIPGKEKRDKYGRLLAYVELSDGTDISAEMIRTGNALAYLKYPCERQDKYIQKVISQALSKPIDLPIVGQIAPGGC